MLHAAWKMDTVGNKAARREIAEIKVSIPNMACQIMDWAIQMHGAGGVSQTISGWRRCMPPPVPCASWTARTRCIGTNWPGWNCRNTSQPGPTWRRSKTDGQSFRSHRQGRPSSLAAPRASAAPSRCGMAEHGAKVVVSSRKADACEAVAADIRAKGGEAIVLPANIGRKEQLQQLGQRHDRALGRDRHSGLQRRREPLFWPGDRLSGRRVRPDHGVERPNPTSGCPTW